ncbi:hypothetical protein D3C72_2154980 [compost metagenome]
MSGAAARTLRTWAITTSRARSISASVVLRPSPKRIEPCIRASGMPIAVSTWEGSRLAEVQAEPEETAISVKPLMRFSPATPSKETLRFPGRRSVGWPLRATPGRASQRPW